jgi:hypothetical protein
MMFPYFFIPTMFRYESSVFRTSPHPIQTNSLNSNPSYIPCSIPSLDYDYPTPQAPKHAYAALYKPSKPLPTFLVFLLGLIKPSADPCPTAKSPIPSPLRVSLSFSLFLSHPCVLKMTETEKVKWMRRKKGGAGIHDCSSRW